MSSLQNGVCWFGVLPGTLYNAGMGARLEQKRLTSFDGTEISYHVGGSGPAVVLANGLGGPLPAYRYIIEQLIPDYRVLTWDYRGLYNSGVPPQKNDLSVEHSVEDMHCLMAEEGIDNAIVLGWSMGVQVCCEFFRLHKEQVSGMILLCGTAGSPFETLPGGQLIGKAVPPLMNFAKCAAKPLEFVGKRVTKWKGLVPMMKRMGTLAPGLDSELFAEIAAEFSGMDMVVYCETLKQLGKHDSHDVLSQINVPTLLVAGEFDLMTPKKTAERMHSEIKDSRLVVVEGGTHYTPVEFPDRIAEEIDLFLRQVPGFVPPGSRQELS